MDDENGRALGMLDACQRVIERIACTIDLAVRAKRQGSTDALACIRRIDASAADVAARNDSFPYFGSWSFKDWSVELDVNAFEHVPTNQIRGIGETSPPPMRAIGNAITRAARVAIRDMRITAEKILGGLREQEIERAVLPDGGRRRPTRLSSREEVAAS